MVTELTEKIAQRLADAGWRSPCDAQWANLEKALPDLRELLSTKPPPKSVPSDAERRLRELARIVDMAEGFDGRFGSEVAADHEMAAISEAFVAARKEGCDSYTSLCRALDVGQPHKPGPSVCTYEDSHDGQPCVECGRTKQRSSEDSLNGRG